MEEQLDQFLEQLLDDKGLTMIEGEVREEVKAGMAERLLDQIDQAVINALPEDKAIELSNKLDDENFTNEDAAQFISDCGVDVSGISYETMLQFRSFYLNNNSEAESSTEA